MKKIFLMLLGVAATCSVMAVDYTAKAKVTLQSESGYSCNLMLSESAEYGALAGSAMNFEDRKVALYVVNGSEKLQIARAASLEGVQLGLMTDASTSYTLTVSAVEGSETLYIWDGEKSFALTEGSVYNFTAAANATDEARLVLKKSPAGPSLCFNYNVLEINGHEGESLVVKDLAGAEKAKESSLPANYVLDLSAESGRLVVTLNGVDYQIDANPTVTKL